MTFRQPEPELSDPFTNDPLLSALLQRLPAERRHAIEPDLAALGQHAVTTWRRRATSTRREPTLTTFDAWGERIDRIELTEAWQEGPGIATRFGLLACGHEAQPWARVEQFARVYLYHVASEFYTCPLAMTDGAATALRAAGNQPLIERALPHFLSRDSDTFWLSGQWMTETPGGSDVGRTETEARQDAAGQWRLYGRKWFSSAVVGNAALALARPQGAGPGTAALALFYVETKDTDGRWQGLSINRLKDKLGTRELPTAEIELDGIAATPVGGLDHGVRLIAPMLNVTRTWNAVCAVATIARANALALDYARRRESFGKSLIEHPLHARTLADMHAEGAAAFALTFFVAELLGRHEQGVATNDEASLLRVLTPATKLWTAKLAVQISSEALECFGGAGYIEDTGLPQLLRDAQVYPIWEGTTNVLSLDVLRALRGVPFSSLRLSLANGQPEVADALDSAERMLGGGNLEAGARTLAITLARTAAAVALSRMAGAPYIDAALRRFISHGLASTPLVDGTDDALLVL